MNKQHGSAALLRGLVLVLGIVVALASVGPSRAEKAGNAEAAHACKHGGYRNYRRADGTRFRNTGECVSYVAHGGTLVPVGGALPDFAVTISCTPGIGHDFACFTTVSNRGTAPVTLPAGMLLVRYVATYTGGSNFGSAWTFVPGYEAAFNCPEGGSRCTIDTVVSESQILGAGASVTFINSVGAERAGVSITSVVTVDPNNLVNEANEGNNTARTRPLATP